MNLFLALLRHRLPCAGCFLVVLAGSAAGLQASRIKDITLVEGGRDNQLVGYGLVVGLAGEGDSNPNATLHSVANVLQRYGITVNPQQDVKAKNTAAVMVTADISAFLKSGARIDVTVASLGDAKTLQGGVLLQTPLIGADGHTYAVAQGPIAIGGFLGGTGGAGGATVQKNHPTVGTISNGAIVEREIPAQFVHNGTMRLLLHNPDFTSAARMARRSTIPGRSRLRPSMPPRSRSASPPATSGREVSFISDLGSLEVTPDTLARVVINERTGTIVATATVRISEVAIADGSLTITITSNVGVSQPNPLSQRTDHADPEHPDDGDGDQGRPDRPEGAADDRAAGLGPQRPRRLHPRDDGHLPDAQALGRPPGRPRHQLGPMQIAPTNAAASLAPELVSQLHRAGESPVAQAKVVSQQFESVLLQQFLDKSVNSMMGDAAGSDVYGYMVTSALAQSLAKGGGLGMASILERQLAPAGQPPAKTVSAKGHL